MTRHIWILLHRWVGLVMAGFLVVAGLTGSLLAFYHQLTELLNPDLYEIKAGADAKLIDPFVLREHAEITVPGASFHFVPLRWEPGHAISMWAEGRTDPITKEHADLGFDEIFFNPYTTEEVLRRKWGDLSQGLHNLMTFIYQLHYSLALGTVGTWAFGIVALLWTIDCFVGFYLTLPVKQKARSTRTDQGSEKRPSFCRRWKPAWLVRSNAGAYRLNFDLHRAGGLWVWAMLFVLAWSSVAFNLSQVYSPVTKALFGMQERPEFKKLAQEQAQPGIPWHEAHRIGQTLMAREAAARGIMVVHDEHLAYDPHHALYSLQVKSSLDRADKEHEGATVVTFDANTGALRRFSSRLDERPGDVITRWLVDLHTARVWGLPYRIFVCAMGLVVAMLSVTGVVIWWKKRSGRVRAAKMKQRATNHGERGMREETKAGDEPAISNLDN